MSSVSSSQTLAIYNVVGLGNVNVAADTTQSVVVQQFTSLISQLQTDAGANNTTGVAADIYQLQQLAENGMPDPTLPGSSLFLNTEMAQVVGIINSSLTSNSPAIPIPTTGLSSSDLTNLAAWVSSQTNLPANSTTGAPAGLFTLVTDPTGVSPTKIPQIQVAANAAVLSNHSLQALIDLEYISQGNNLISSQMQTLSTALNSLQSAINQLNSLQGLMSNLVAPTSATYNQTSDASGNVAAASAAFNSNQAPNPLYITGTATYASIVGNGLGGTTGPIQQVELVNARYNLAQLYTQLQGDGNQLSTSDPNGGTNPTDPTSAGFATSLPGTIRQVINDIDSYIYSPPYAPTPPGTLAAGTSYPNPPLPGSNATVFYTTDTNGNQIGINIPGDLSNTATVPGANNVSLLPTASSSNTSQLGTLTLPASNTAAIIAAIGIPMDSETNSPIASYTLTPPSSAPTNGVYYQVSNASGNFTSPQSFGIASVISSTSNTPQYGSLPSPNLATYVDNAQAWVPVDVNNNPVAFTSIQITQSGTGWYDVNSGSSISVLGANGQPVSYDHFALLRVGETDSNGNPTAQIVMPVMQNPTGTQMVANNSINIVSQNTTTNASGATTNAPITLGVTASGNVEPINPVTVITPNVNIINSFGGYPTNSSGNAGIPFGILNPAMDDGFDQTAFSYTLTPNYNANGILSGFSTSPFGTYVNTIGTPPNTIVLNTSTVFNSSPEAYAVFTSGSDGGDPYTFDSNSTQLDLVQSTSGNGIPLAVLGGSGPSNVQLYPVNAQGQLLTYSSLKVTMTFTQQKFNVGNFTQMEYGGGTGGTSVIPVDANGNPVPGFAGYAPSNVAGGGYASPVTNRSVWGFILDGLSSTSGISSSSSGNNSNDLSTAITASQNLNADQQQALQRYMFVFQEFYQSASAILTTINSAISQMTQGMGQ